MKKEIIISEVNDLAVVYEDGRAVEFFLRHGDQLVGDIIWGQVEAVVPGIEAAFVNIGQDRNGFIHVADLPSAQAPRRQAAPRKPSIKVKERILVQIAKAPTGNKGARLTGRLTIPGRFLVLVPHDNRVSISRRIVESHERDRLRRLTLKLKDPGHGVIVRTEAIGRSEEDLRQDIEELIDIWADVLHQMAIVAPPSLLHRDSDLIHRVLRDAMSAEVSKVVVDTAAGYQKAREILQGWNPELARNVVQHKGSQSILSRYRISEELEAAISPKVWLPSGGYLIIEPTEALTVIDVNSGRTQSKSLADTVLRTNIEAAAEVARQLRLRDIGGIVVIDFISMDAASDRNKVLQAFHEALREDKSRPQVTGFSEHGLIEVSRRRQGQNLLEQLTRPCEECEGTGRVRTSPLVTGAHRHEAASRVEETSAIIHEITEEPMADEVLLPEGEAGEEEELEVEVAGNGGRRRRRRRRGRGRTGEVPMGHILTTTAPEGLTPEDEDEEGFLPPVLVPAEPVAHRHEGRARRSERREPAARAEAPVAAEGPFVEEVALDLFATPAPRERGGRERREERAPREDRFAREARAPREDRFAREERFPREERLPREERQPREGRLPREARAPREEQPVARAVPAARPAEGGGRTRRVERRGPEAEPVASEVALPEVREARPARPAREAKPAAAAPVAPVAPAKPAAKAAAPAPAPVAEFEPFKPEAPAAALPIPEEVMPDAVPGLFVLKKKEPKAAAPAPAPVEEEAKKAAPKRRASTARRATKAKVEEAPEAPVEEAPKPKATRKKATPKPAAEEAPAEEKPKKRTATRRATKAKE